MFCQQCGSSIRLSAKFCNVCGSEVKQRFSPQTEALSSSEGEQPKVSGKKNGLSDNSWPGAEETIIIPIVAGSQKEPKEGVAAVASAASSADPAPKAAKPKREPSPARPGISAPKQFFTEVMPSLENRQHGRLVFVVPVLLLVFIILLVFAILVLPYIVAK